MLRACLVSFAVLGVLAAPGGSVAPAQAHGIVRVPTETKAELAAIRKALPKAKLSRKDRAKIEKLFAEASMASISEADREKAISQTMKMLDLPRESPKDGC
jgi:hypothetical protein